MASLFTGLLGNKNTTVANGVAYPIGAVVAVTTGSAFTSAGARVVSAGVSVATAGSTTAPKAAASASVAGRVVNIAWGQVGVSAGSPALVPAVGSVVASQVGVIGVSAAAQRGVAGSAVTVSAGSGGFAAAAYIQVVGSNTTVAPGYVSIGAGIDGLALAAGMEAKWLAGAGVAQGVGEYAWDTRQGKSGSGGLSFRPIRTADVEAKGATVSSASGSVHAVASVRVLARLKTEAARLPEPRVIATLAPTAPAVRSGSAVVVGSAARCRPGRVRVRLTAAVDSGTRIATTKHGTATASAGGAGDAVGGSIRGSAGIAAPWGVRNPTDEELVAMVRLARSRAGSFGSRHTV